MSDYHNSEYWEKRIANETWKTYNNVEEQNRDLLNMYEKTSSSIKRELYSLAEAAEEQGGLTRSQQYRFNKLLGQQGVIFQEIEKLGESIEKSQTSRIMDTGKKVYSNVMHSLNINDFSYPNKKQMEQMLRSKWHGSFFSERLWNDMGALERNLNGVINNFIATGKTVTEAAVQLSNVMNRSFNDAHRLVRTETINYMNRSALRGYKDAGITKVQWWAAEDERTCEICGANHGKEYDIEKAPILPCHPGCRCTWLPIIEENKSQELLESEKAAVVKYVGPDAYTLNDNLRNGYSLTEEEKDWIKQLDSALSKMPTINGIVNRSLAFMYREDRIKFIDMHKPGSEINYHQYLSSSINEVYNEDAEVQIIILSKNGRDIRSFNPKENEILFMRETKFIVIQTKKVEDTTYIYLEEE
ncbi:phage head morphogenesis protein [Eubacterium sp. TF05-29]|uniref:minor capsid protein n=1 Tax=Longicatena caecimuris TaxID=1796635 RepID=UPI000E74870C|nr:minor capsid protein [Longicatena caecimuris]RJW06382.1 phage head morphogenesis protein [Eubacterium sp. AM28-8LB]RJW29253.1 phage head morphogenesis protein [Eubacterium sp. TF05-29]